MGSSARRARAAYTRRLSADLTREGLDCLLTYHSKARSWRSKFERRRASRARGITALSDLTVGVTSQVVMGPVTLVQRRMWDGHESKGLLDAVVEEVTAALVAVAGTEDE